MDFSFPKSCRLRKRREFKRHARRSERRLGRWIVLDIASGGAQTKLGITVTRRFGKAHLRNRFKRLVREAFRLSIGRLPPGYVLHVRPRGAAAEAKFEDIRKELIALATLKCTD